METPYENKGVILGRRPEDWVAGAASGVAYEVRNPSGDWRPYLPPGENQYSDRGDSMSCVTYSALNSIEMQEKLLTGTAPDYGDRWTAKRSGTMRNGNYLYKVADTIRKEGLVLESDYPTPLSYNWDEYHAEIPEPLSSQLLAKGQDWLKKWTVGYEWITVSQDSFRYHLKHAPIQVVIPGHAIVEILCEADIVSYFDTYAPYIKQVNVGGIQDALKIVLTAKTQMTSNGLLVQNGQEFGIYLPATTVEGLASLMLNIGKEVPRTPDGKVDFTKIKADKQLVGF